MATISSMFNSGYSANSLFSSLSGSTSASSNILSDYAAIRNGSYKKLMSAYYKQESGSTSKSALSRDDLNSMVTAFNKTTSTASSLSSSISSLNDSKLYDKKDITTTDENGKKTKTNDYDWDSITKNVKSFVDAYNDTLDDAANSSSTSVLRNAAWMTKITNKNAASLAKAGITVGSDNKLKVDEDKLKSADINDVKNLFSGTSSYGAQMNYKAQTIGTAANNLANTYTGRGTYSNSFTSTWGTTI